MRIGIDVTKALPPRDGIGNYTYHLVRALMELDRRNDYRLYGLSGPLEGEALDRTFPDRPSSFSPVTTRYPATGDVDVFHSTTLIFPVLYRGPAVFTCHDLTFLTHPECHALVNKIQATTAVLQAILAGATFACVSRATADELHRHLGVGEDRLAVIHHGAASHFRPGDREEARQRVRERFGVERPFVLCVGTLEPRKNQRRLIEAWADLPEEVRSHHELLLAGAEGWKLESALGPLDGRPELAGVRLVGRVDEEELVTLYNAATVFAYPSLAEGFGLPVLEALACGTPVITSTASSLPEVAGNAARLVDPLDTGDLKRALEELLADAGERRRLSRLGRERAATFTWEKAARLHLELYEHVATRV